MILDRLENANFYRGLGPRIALAFDYLTSTRFAETSDGRYELDESDVYAVVSRYQPKSIDEAVWEAHRSYLDVQYVAEGAECVGYAPLSDDLTVRTPYDPQKDFILYNASGDLFVLGAGNFAIFAPQDVHAPCLMGREGMSAQVCKVVVKCRVDQAAKP